VRAVSSHGAMITWPDHVAWLNRVLSTRDRWLFVGQVGQLPVGSIRFDRTSPTELEVSLYLDPELQGLGLGPQLLQGGELAMANRLGNAFTVRATVLPGNTASQRLFEACRYHGGPLQYSKTVERLDGRLHEDS